MLETEKLNIVSHMFKWPNSLQVLLTLRQHGFELCRSVYSSFFQWTCSVQTQIVQGPTDGWESVNAEVWLKLYLDFQLHRWLILLTCSPPTPLFRVTCKCIWGWYERHVWGRVWLCLGMQSWVSCNCCSGVLVFISSCTGIDGIGAGWGESGNLFCWGGPQHRCSGTRPCSHHRSSWFPGSLDDGGERWPWWAGSAVLFCKSSVQKSAWRPSTHCVSS